MVVVSYSGKEVNAKLVFYGPGLSGKTTNLEAIYDSVPSTHRGKMVSMKTRSERTLFFDFLPVDLGDLHGFKTRFLIYTVPGQVYYNATRKLVLRGVDALVFVADSQRGKMDENKESLANLRENLSEYGIELASIPWVIQYNKRDLPDIYPVDEMERELNPEGVPHFDAVAQKGLGVFETFRGVAKLLLARLETEVKPEGRMKGSPIVERMERMKNAPADTPVAEKPSIEVVRHASREVTKAGPPPPAVPAATGRNGDETEGPRVKTPALATPSSARSSETVVATVGIASRPGLLSRLFGGSGRRGRGGMTTREVLVPVTLSPEEASNGVELHFKIVLEHSESSGAGTIPVHVEKEKGRDRGRSDRRKVRAA